jgi:hypothetical protein
MLVERRDHFDPLRAVMDLMESEPKEIQLVSPAMPPVKDERFDEVGDEATEERRDVG